MISSAVLILAMFYEWRWYIFWTAGYVLGVGGCLLHRYDIVRLPHTSAQWGAVVIGGAFGLFALGFYFTYRRLIGADAQAGTDAPQIPSDKETAAPDNSQVVLSGQPAKAPIPLGRLGLVVGAIVVISLVFIPCRYDGGGSGNESAAVTTLRQYLSAQGTYHRTDYDEDGSKEYAADLVNLYDWDGPGGTDPIRLVDLATAKAHYARPETGGQNGYDGAFIPRSGYYFVDLLGGEDGVRYESAAGDKSPVGLTNGFGLVAFPAKFNRTGLKTFIINEEGTVYENIIVELDIEHTEKLPRFSPSGREMEDEGWIMVGE
jgi:hypothetical protein